MNGIKITVIVDYNEDQISEALRTNIEYVVNNRLSAAMSGNIRTVSVEIMKDLPNVKQDLIDRRKRGIR